MLLETKISELYGDVHALAFDSYLRKGRVPEALQETLRLLAAMRVAFRDTGFKYNPDEPRVPAGNPDGGQWTTGGGGGPGSLLPDVTDPNYSEPGLTPFYGFEEALFILFGGPSLLPARIARGLTGGAHALEAAAVRARLESMLAPGGEAIGEAGTDETIRELPGGVRAAEKMFKNLTKGGKLSTPATLSPKGARYAMPDGSYIMYRPKSTSGPPTIDVNVSSLKNMVKKLKFLDRGKP